MRRVLILRALSLGDLATAVPAFADDEIEAELGCDTNGRSEYGLRALGHRSLLAHPGHPDNTERLNNVKGRIE